MRDFTVQLDRHYSSRMEPFINPAAYQFKKHNDADHFVDPEVEDEQPPTNIRSRIITDDEGHGLKSVVE